MLYLIIYLIGCIISYPLFKYIVLQGSELRWTRGDRAMALISSLLSWLSVVASLASLLASSTDSDKPAKW